MAWTPSLQCQVLFIILMGLSCSILSITWQNSTVQQLSVVQCSTSGRMSVRFVLAQDGRGG